MVKLNSILLTLACIGGFSSINLTSNTLKNGEIYVSDDIEIPASYLTVNESSALIDDDESLNTRSIKNPLIEGLYNHIRNIFLPTAIQDLHKLIVQTPPKKLTIPRVFKHGTLQEVKDYLHLSVISSCTKETVLNSNCGCQKVLTDLSVIENEDFDALTVIGVERKNKLIVVAYRASQTVQNYIINFSYPKVDYPYLAGDIRIHHGFLSHYLSTYNEVQEAVKKLLVNPQFKGYTLHITGYSLGAAVSQISLPNWIKLLKELNDSRPIVNFAYSSPRIGNDNFVQFLHSLNVPITRYTNQNDIVPHLPPRTGDFVHAGAEVHERQIKGSTRTELVYCEQGVYDENPECSWNERNPVSLIRHVTPMDTLPSTPSCD